MEQRGIDWMSQVAPHDNYGKIVTRVYEVGQGMKTFYIPSSALRVLYVGIKVEGRVYQLTVDPNIAMPPSIQFQCDPQGGGMETFGREEHTRLSDQAYHTTQTTTE